MRYDAFISYSHRADERIAAALQRGLQQFAKSWYRRRALHVFLDRADLSASPGLWSSVETALKDSKHFILLACPEAAQSDWVRRELDAWLSRSGSTDRLLILRTGGRIEWDSEARDFDWRVTDALPENLRGRFVEEPRYIGWPQTDAARFPPLDDAGVRDVIADLAAPLHGRSKSEMVGEDIRQHRRVLRVAYSAAICFLALTVIALLGWGQARKQTGLAQEQTRFADRQTKRAQENERTAKRERARATEEAERAQKSERAEKRERNRAEKQTKLAQNNARNALLQRSLAEKRSRVADSRRLALEALNHLDDQLDLSLLLSVEAYRAHPTFEARASLLRGLQYVPNMRTFLRHGGAGRSEVFALSSDGRSMAWVETAGSVTLMDTATGERLLLPFTDEQGSPTSLSFSPDGRMIACGCTAGEVIVWKVGSPSPTRWAFRGHKRSVTAVAFSPKGKLLASAHGDLGLILWDMEKRERVRDLPCGAMSQVKAVAFSPDGTLVTAGGIESSAQGMGRTVKGGILLWDLTTDPPTVRRFDQELGPVECLAISAGGTVHGQVLASGHLGGAVNLWRLWTPEPELYAMLPGDEQLVSSLAFSHDGRTLASSGVFGNAVVWDLTPPREQPKPLAGPASGRAKAIMALAFSADDSTLWLAYQDGAVALWNVPAAACLGLGTLLPRSATEVASVAFSPDSTWLATGGRNLVPGAVWQGVITLRKARTAEQVGVPLTVHRAAITSLAFSPDAKRLACGAEDGSIILWSPQTRQRVGTPLVAHTQRITGLAFNRDGKALFSGSRDRSIIAWDLSRPRPQAERRVRHSAEIRALALSPDGKTLATGDSDFALELWDAATLGPIKRSRRHANWVNSVVFSPDGSTIASASMDHTVVLWDAATLQPERQAFAEHRCPVWSVAYGPDDATLASSDHEGNVILWNPRRGETLGEPLADHSTPVWALAFSPDGKRLASGDKDGNVIVLELSQDAWIARARQIANRNLTEQEWRQYFGQEPYRKTFDSLP
jgi:WD40 repeat protein